MYFTQYQLLGSMLWFIFSHKRLEGRTPSASPVHVKNIYKNHNYQGGKKNIMEKTIELKKELVKTLAAIKRDFPYIDFENEYEYTFIKEQVYTRAEIDLDSVSDDDWWWAVDNIELGLELLEKEEKEWEERARKTIRLPKKYYHRVEKPYKFENYPTIPLGEEPEEVKEKMKQIIERVKGLIKEAYKTHIPDNAKIVYNGDGIWVVEKMKYKGKTRTFNRTFVFYNELTDSLTQDNGGGKYKKRFERGHIVDDDFTKPRKGVKQ